MRACRVGTAGWVYRVGTGRAIPVPSQLARGEVHVQRSGPRKPRRGWSGWYMERGRPGGRYVPPFGPGRSLAGPSLYIPRRCRLRANTARFKDILLKVSQNGGVSPEYVEKACHSPCAQNPVQKSPLEILRFPFRRAFSHKELMGHFDGHSGIIVKTTKCRQYVHPRVRERVVRYPHGPRQTSCLLWSAPHLTQRGMASEPA